MKVGPALPAFRRVARALLVAAVLWALLVGAWLLATPVTVERIEATRLDAAQGAEPAPAPMTVEHLSWYQVQGLWGVIVLFLFAVIYAAAAVLLWTQRNGAGVIVSLLALLLTFLAGFSIGGLYLPSALAVLIVLLLLAVAEVGRRTLPPLD